jgi:putative membrane protein
MKCSARSVSLMAITAAMTALAGCSTTARAPQSSNLSPQDLQFATTTYQLVHFDLNACAVVKKAALTAAVRPVADKICADAAHYAPLIRQQAAATNTTLPDTLPQEYKAKLVALTYKPQPNLSAAFVRDEIQSHESALAVYREEMRSGVSPTYRRIAEETLPVIEQNLRDLRAVQTGGTGA